MPTPSRFLLDLGLPGRHQHVLESKYHPSLERGVLERVRKGLSFLTAQTSAQKGVLSELSASDDTDEDNATLEETYGQRWKVIGRGAYGTVSIFRRPAKNGQDIELFAVKEFHRRSRQTSKRQMNQVVAEFLLASNLQHANVIHTMDLFQSDEVNFHEVMEYCAAGDLFSLVQWSGRLRVEEAECFFKQLVRGVKYLHGVGVAHCDLKPENLLLTTDGCLKISDFGFSQQLRPSSGDRVKTLSGVRGTAEYISPEEYTQEEFDGKAADIWACGVIYTFLILGRYLWHSAQLEDECYVAYIEGRRREEGYVPVESLSPIQCRNVVYAILEPVPSRRLTASQVLRSEWGRSIEVCRAGGG